MFRFFLALASLGYVVYKTIYGNFTAKEPKEGNSVYVPNKHQPIATTPSTVPVTSTTVKLPPKPQVMVGEPLTDEEWEWINSQVRRDVN